MIYLKDTMNFLKETLRKNDTLVLGVSGGPDSMCLFDLINSLKEEYNLKIIVAHINHGIRKESEEEETFVKKTCEEKNCLFTSQKLEFTEKRNFEFQARQKRYQFFKEVVKKYNAKYLVTAHHGDDLMETVLMHMTRGSILHGYSGFQNKTVTNDYILLRPLIYTTKKEIEEYNKVHNIEYRLDVSNESSLYTRNRFRKNILPFLKEENKNVHQKFLKFSEELNEIDRYLEKQTKIALTTVFDFGKVNLPEWKKLDSVLQHRVLEFILKEEYQDNIHNLNSKHLKLIESICNSKKANGKINLPLKKTLIKEYDTLYFRPNVEENTQEIILEEKAVWNEFTICKIPLETKEKNNFILRLNSNEVVLPLKVRNRKIGDKMTIKNFTGTKKIKDIFINEKISVEKRKNWPVVVDANNTILWLPGVKKSKFDKNIDDFYDIIYKYGISEEKKNEEK